MGITKINSSINKPITTQTENSKRKEESQLFQEPQKRAF